jgi:hypothetical protein
MSEQAALNHLLWHYSSKVFVSEKSLCLLSLLSAAVWSGQLSTSLSQAFNMEDKIPKSDVGCCKAGRNSGLLTTPLSIANQHRYSNIGKLKYQLPSAFL